MMNALEIGKSSGHSQPVLSDLLQTKVEKIANGKARYSYEGTLKAAQQVNWQIEDIIGGAKRLDFAKRFMPENEIPEQFPVGIEEVSNSRFKIKERGAAVDIIERLIALFGCAHMREREEAVQLDRTGFDRRRACGERGQQNDRKYR